MLDLELKEKHFSSSTAYYRNINEMVLKTLSNLFWNGKEQQTRNGPATCLYDQEAVMLNPLARHLSLFGRTNNFFGTLGEMFWVMAGEENISPVLEFFVPRAPLYSDNGKTWHAAYGDRLWNYGQFKHVLKMFQEDGIETRRATQSIFIPQLDAYDNYMEAEGTMKDVPCNQWINYYVQTIDDVYYLNMKTTQRSSDIIFGLGNINIPEFTLIQEMVLGIIKELYPDKKIKLGVYKHLATNLHVYDAVEKQFENIMKNYTNNHIQKIPFGDDYLEAKFPSIETKDGLEITRIQRFFKEIIILFDKAIQKEISYKDSKEALNFIFDAFKTPKEENSLYAYGIVCLAYICSKVGDKVIINDFEKEIKVSESKISGFKMAVSQNKFLNFEIH